MTDTRLNTGPSAPTDLTSAVFQTVGHASVCWENMSGTGVFNDVEARVAAENLLSWIKDLLDPDTLARIFKDAWHEADRIGKVGSRTDAGIAAVTAYVLGETPEDPDQLALFEFTVDCE